MKVRLLLLFVLFFGIIFLNEDTECSQPSRIEWGETQWDGDPPEDWVDCINVDYILNKIIYSIILSFISVMPIFILKNKESNYEIV